MTDTLTATVDASAVRRISTDLWGIFFEDISSAADGGLACELVQNGAFEYSRADHPDWSGYTAWRKPVPAGSFAAFGLRAADPVAEENPHHARIEVRSVAGGPVGLENTGFDGMVFRAGETYRFSMWARTASGGAMPVRVELAGDDGAPLADAGLSVSSRDWTRYEVTLSVPASSAADCAAYGGCGGGGTPREPWNGPALAVRGTLRVMFLAEGVADVDFVSCEPASTYKGLEHCRPDLVRALDELHPRFVRFPGGCITHGLGLDNMYRWERTIGPVEHRPHDFNVWGYHQSFRIGFYEYFRLCETIGAKPLPVLPAGVSCQNTSQGPVPIADEDMPGYIDSVLGLIDFCNADPETNEWAARRAGMGHPEPFGLEYLGIGNEDRIDPVFEDRFRRIHDAVRAAHPEIVIVGTVGPDPSGRDYDEGWRIARELDVPIVDEHSYRSPSWWFRNLDHYDHADRSGPRIYLGEYGSRDVHLLNGLAEAAAMGRMEANGDVVTMASYAPLLCKNGHNSWDPDLIYFDNERVYRTYSYWVQRMFAAATADTAWPVAVDGDVMFRRRLPRTVGLSVTGGASADITDIVVTTDSGERVELPGIAYRGNGPVSTGLALDADSYTVDMTVTYHEGMWGVQVHMGDVDGPDHNVVSFGRSFELQLVREGCGSTIAGTEVSMDAVRPGTAWHARVAVSDRGAGMALDIDGRPVVSGWEDPAEPRRAVAVARDSASGTTYLRVVNAMAAPVSVDLSRVLAALDIPMASRSAATASVLTAGDPYAGVRGEEAPTRPVETPCDLGAGVYEAPAWSFTVIAV
ncbi:alpha-L-arabinofuranosidase C-terminal domain-containing protein [Bifidobacterium phasiani]|uniref:Alpha-L-arabinofuranosidase n=1 Tax=Bifidobacterium phasiani TaxID=2834431 RepID=A0ABS6W6K5_9BIFI|nr:alpha-L-arabinofuranosidase C-terminal domain-containing protein [Bifidobacterium phasiani]MBW3082110.1 alpha-L-arabinofuranosidase [Bifidobacterium phasiani]